MQVKLERAFPVEARAETAWRFLQDIPGVAGCMPGAEVTEQVDDTHYKGAVKVKVGPAVMAFNGDIEVRGLDAGRRELRLYAKGSDTKGSSAASMDLTARIEPADDGSCELLGVSEVTVSGKMASFGGRMMNQVADQILKQFAANFAQRAVALEAEGPAQGKVAAEAPAASPQALNGLALAWAVLIGFVKGLFGPRKGSAAH